MKTLMWITNGFSRSLVAGLLVIALAISSLTPAFAETAGQRSTRNIILGGAALAIGIILYNNYERKVRAANTVVGYTRDGGVVYADGRIVYPNGRVVYASNNGQTVCDWDNDGDNQPCGQQVYAYNSQQPPYGHAYGHYKHHHGGDDNEQGDE
jgi:hypothetical protein